MKNGRALLDALSEVIGWTDEWEDEFPWIDMDKNTHYDETEPTSPVKTSWCQVEEGKDLWAIEVVTGGSSRSGGGWFGDDLEINSFELNWKWSNGGGEWLSDWEEGDSPERKEKAHAEFRKWLKNSEFSDDLVAVDSGGA